MGRQIQIAATQGDEDAFLSFLRDTAAVRIFGSFAATPEALWVDTFDPNLTGHWGYSIWNTTFSWKPEYSQVTRARDPKQNGHWYVRNKQTAPVIEFSRSDVAHRRYGRIYWAKEFSAPHGLAYDVDAFSKWYDLIVRWIRKNGQRDKTDHHSPYFLPDAWKTRMTK